MRLILIRHAAPQLDWGSCSHEWPLSSGGVAAAQALAERLVHLEPTALFHSLEPKAVQTAEPIASACGLQAIGAAELGEHRREHVTQLHRVTFRRSVRTLFEHRSEVVFGEESGDAAASRFAEAIGRIEADVAIVVAHGTVMSLYAEQIGAVRSGWELWNQLTLPGVIVLDDGALTAIERFPPSTFLREEAPASLEPLRAAVSASSTASSLGRLGDGLRASGDLREAETALRRALDLPSDTNTRAANVVRLAVALRYQARFAEAIDLFESLREPSGELRSFWAQHYGKCLVEAGRSDSAIALFRRALELRSDPELVASTTRALAAAVRPQMPRPALLDLLDLFAAHRLEVWLDGGWAVDALLGAQTRAHADLDIAITTSSAEVLRSLLAAREWVDIATEDRTPWNFVMGDVEGQRIDFHVIELDGAGRGIYGPVEDGVFYPADSLLGRATVEGRMIRCIAPEWLVRFHTGYAFDEDDVHDVLALADRFGIALPAEYEEFR